MRQGYDFSQVSVLIVDDSAYMRHIVKALLLGLGFRHESLHEAEDGVDAFRTFRNANIDLIILDWEMPILNGVEFTRMVRTSSDSPNFFVPIIMLTGHSESKRVIEARDAGVHEFVVKPVSAAVLYSRMVAVIERPRPFVRTRSFVGPDRRRKISPQFEGRDRRAAALEIAKGLGARALSQQDVDGLMCKH